MKPTPEQIQRACDLANGPNDTTPWFQGSYGACAIFTALADTIAQLDAMQAERDKARADLGEIDRGTGGKGPHMALKQATFTQVAAWLGDAAHNLEMARNTTSTGHLAGWEQVLCRHAAAMLSSVAAIAAPYRVETDPLVAEIGRLAAKHSVELSCEDVRSIASYFKPIGRQA